MLKKLQSLFAHGNGNIRVVLAVGVIIYAFLSMFAYNL